LAAPGVDLGLLVEMNAKGLETRSRSDGSRIATQVGCSKQVQKESQGHEVVPVASLEDDSNGFSDSAGGLCEALLRTLSQGLVRPIPACLKPADRRGLK